ncbi:hypothetical protein EVG20_g4408, partial [Dentipellis fragilis]
GPGARRGIGRGGGGADDGGGNDGGPGPGGRGGGRGPIAGVAPAVPAPAPIRRASGTTTNAVNGGTTAARPPVSSISATGPARPPNSRQGVSQPPPVAGPSRIPNRTANPGPEVQCDCGVSAKELTVTKDNANKGRPFFTCGNDKKCNFFQWGDEPPPSVAQKGRSLTTPSAIPSKRPYPDHLAPQSASTEPKRCRCDLTAVLKMVNKEGANQNRKFWACPNSEQARCGFFEWEDNDAGPSSGLGGRSNSVGQERGPVSGECFKVCVGWRDIGLMLVQMMVPLRNDRRALRNRKAMPVVPVTSAVRRGITAVHVLNQGRQNHCPVHLPFPEGRKEGAVVVVEVGPQAGPKPEGNLPSALLTITR